MALRCYEEHQRKHADVDHVGMLAVAIWNAGADRLGFAFGGCVSDLYEDGKADRT